MEPVPNSSRAPPQAPYVIRGEAYLDVNAAARLIEVVPQSTLRRWVKAGWTSFGMSLDVVQHQRQLLIPELCVRVVKEFLHDHPLPRPGMPRSERDAFKRAAQEFNLLRPRSTYSRARQPRRQSPRP